MRTQTKTCKMNDATQANGRTEVSGATGGRHRADQWAARRGWAVAGLLGVLLLGVGAGRAQTAGAAATAQAAPAAPAAAAPPVAAVPAGAQQANAQQSKPGNNEGIRVHGHWIIDVRNPDGSLAEHRDFENSLAGYGSELLAALMSGYAVPSDYAIFVSSGGNAPCTQVADAAVIYAYQACGLVRSLTTLPASALCQYYTCFTTLTYTPTLIDSSATGSQLVFSGAFVASQAGTISSVSTLFGTCPANLLQASSLATVTPAACSTTPGIGGYRTMTAAAVTTVNIAANQIVQVTVTISFS